MNHPEPIPGSKTPKDTGSDADRYFIGPDGKKSSKDWCWISREFDNLKRSHGLPGNKVPFRIICHISRRESDERGCDAGIKSIAGHVGSHPVYVKAVINYLEAIGLVLKIRRPGRTSILRLADKQTWLKNNPPGKIKIKPPELEESEDEARKHALWYTLWEVAPDLVHKPFARMMKQNIDVLEAAVKEVANIVRKSKDPRFAAEGLTPIGNPAGAITDLFQRWSKANTGNNEK